MAPVILKIALGVGLGAGLGALMGYFGNCTTGSCPLTSTPWRGAVFGALAGLAVALALGAAVGTRSGDGQIQGSASGTETAVAAGQAEVTKPREIASEADFKAAVEDARGLVFVDFHAQWCGWCKKLEPVIDKLAGEYAGKVAFVKVDTDAHKDLAGRYKVQGLPTMIVFRDGRPVETIVGYRDEAALKAILDKLLAGDGKK